MLEDLRKIASEPVDEPPVPEEKPASGPSNRRRRPFLGMTAGQRLVISILLLVMVLVLGILCLLATGKVVLP